MQDPLITLDGFAAILLAVIVVGLLVLSTVAVLKSTKGRTRDVANMSFGGLIALIPAGIALAGVAVVATGMVDLVGIG